MDICLFFQVKRLLSQIKSWTVEKENLESSMKNIRDQLLAKIEALKVKTWTDSFYGFSSLKSFQFKCCIFINLCPCFPGRKRIPKIILGEFDSAKRRTNQKGWNLRLQKTSWTTSKWTKIVHMWIFCLRFKWWKRTRSKIWRENSLRKRKKFTSPTRNWKAGISYIWTTNGPVIWKKSMIESGVEKKIEKHESAYKVGSKICCFFRKCGLYTDVMKTNWTF